MKSFVKIVFIKEVGNPQSLKQMGQRPEMRGNIRGAATFPTTIATLPSSSSSLLVLIGSLELAQY